MKKLFALLLALLLVFSLVACSSNGDDASDDDANSPSTDLDEVVTDNQGEEGEDPTPVTIGFSLSSNDETMQEFRDEMENVWKAEKEAQYNVTLEFL